MYEFHGWLSLSESTEESDVGGLDSALAGLRPLLDGFEPHRSRADVTPLNGEYVLRLDGLLNRAVDEARALDDVLAYLAARLPGSWGLLYDRDDAWRERELAGRFRVRVLARGVVTVRDDPFLSPWQPTIED